MAETIITKYELDVTQFQQRLTEIEIKLGIVKTQGQAAAKGISTSLNATSLEVAKMSEAFKQESIKRITALQRERQLLQDQKLALKEMGAVGSTTYKALQKDIQDTSDRIMQMGAAHRSASAAAKLALSEQKLGLIAVKEAAIQAKVASEQGTGAIIEGGKKAFSAMRTLANIIPGIGISGLFLLAFEAISAAASEMGIFASQTKEAKKEIDDLAKSNIKLGDTFYSNIVNIRKLNFELAEKQFAKKYEGKNEELLKTDKKYLSDKAELENKRIKMLDSNFRTEEYNTDLHLLELQRLRDVAADNEKKATEELNSKTFLKNGKRLSRGGFVSEEDIEQEELKLKELESVRKNAQSDLDEELNKSKARAIQLEIDKIKIEKDGQGARKEQHKKEVVFHEEINKDYELYLKQKETLENINLKNTSNAFELLKLEYEKALAEQQKLADTDIRSQARVDEIKILLGKNYNFQLVKLLQERNLILEKSDIEGRQAVVKTQLLDIQKGTFKELQLQKESEKLSEEQKQLGYDSEIQKLVQHAKDIGATQEDILKLEEDFNKKRELSKQESLKRQEKLEHDYMVAQINRVQEAGNTIFKAVEQQQEHQQKLTGLKLDKEEKQQNIERERAEKGLKNNLAFEDKRVAELEKKQLDQAKKERNLKLSQILINSILEYVKRDPDTAVPKGLLVAALSLGATAAFGEKGGLLGDNKMPTTKIGTINNPYFSRTHTGGGDMLVQAQSGESLFSRDETKAISELGGGGKSGFYNFKDSLKGLNYGKINKDISEIKYVSTATTIDIIPLQQEMKELKNIVKGQKQFDPVQFIEEQNKFIIKTTQNNIKKEIELQYRKNRIG